MKQDSEIIDLSKRNHTDFEIEPFQTQSLLDKIQTLRKERALKKNYDFADNDHIFGFFGFLFEQPGDFQPQMPKSPKPENLPLSQVRHQARRRRINRTQRRQNNLVRNQHLNRRNLIRRQTRNQPENRQIRTITSRRFNTSPGLLISGIKDLSRNFVFDGVFVQDMNDYVITAQCFERIRKIIKKLSSRVGVKRQLRMIFNLNDPVLNGEIAILPKKTQAEEDFLNLLNEFGSFIVDLAKLELKHLLIQGMSPEWMEVRAESRAFYDGVESAETRYRRREFHRYLQHFRENLRRDFGILETLDRRAFALQFGGEE